MTFDKSKVCVAGLHELKEGTKGWVSDELYMLNDYVEREDKDMFIVCIGGTGKRYRVEDGGEFRYFYPTQEKQYHPFETTEEARVLMGKLIRHKYDTELFMVTSIDIGALSGMLLINGYTTQSLFNDFVIDETGEPVGVEI